jgi:signal transduction histidine kinase
VTSPATILVVDDQDAGRFVKVQTLRRSGFTVSEAGTGADALLLIASQPPDLVILDVNLPDMSGFDVTRRIRQSETGPPTLQILQVSNTAVENEDRVRGLEQGADVYLTEPVDGTVLVATVQALLRVRRAETALADALRGERGAREIAEQANRLKDEFIATLSHELRTPLNALMGWIWQLRNATLDAPARERALDSIERNARMQAQLINDLLDVSRASKGKLQLEIRLVDLKQVIESALESVREPMGRKNLEVSTSLQSVAVAGDQARLQQVVTNLLTNSVQFTPPDGRVSITLAGTGGEAVLSVQDTGAGIEPAFIPHVFEQFRQGEGGLSRKHGGLGLGLAVVKQLIELHGGSVTVTSAGTGKGATFTVRLPREAVTGSAVKRDGSGLLLETLRVLIFSDADGESSTLKTVLESSGARVAVRPLAAGTAAPSAAPDCDLIVSEQRGTVKYRVPDSVAPDGTWQSLPATAPPAEIVRRIAQATTMTKAS